MTSERFSLTLIVVIHIKKLYHSSMTDRQCLECGKTFESSGSVRRHVKVHGLTLEAYVLKHVHGGKRPLCACGCSGEPRWSPLRKDYQRYVHTHHLGGRPVSVATREKIGAANSVNMRAFWHANPTLAKRRAAVLRSGITADAEARRIASTRAHYADLSPAEREKIGSRMKRLWHDGSDVMQRAHVKATETFKQRAAAGDITFAERNRKISETVAQLYVDGGFAWARGQHVSPKAQGPQTFRSSWEKQHFELLDADSDVISWCAEPFSIAYELNGRQRRYVPDVIVERHDRVQLIEVKPESLRSTPMNAAKRSAALAYCAKNGIEYVEWQPNERAAKEVV